MPLSDNEKRVLQIETEKEIIFKHLENPLISQPFTEDFARRFSWSTNAIEGNTLSLEETIAVIDYDEVRSNHTYFRIYRCEKSLLRDSGNAASI